MQSTPPSPLASVTPVTPVTPVTTMAPKTPARGRAASAAAGHRPAIALVSVHGDPLLPCGAEEAGGQNVYVRELARALAERGHRVDVFTRGREVTQPEETTLGRARVIRLPAGPRGFVSRNDLDAYLPEFVVNARRWARRDGARYDVLHTNYWLSGWVGMQLAGPWGAPQVHTHHSLGAVKYAAAGGIPAAGGRRLEVEDALSASCQAIVATSPQDVVALARYYPTAAPTTIVPCGVDPMIFRPRDRAESRALFGLDTGELALTYCGRFDPQKGIETFVRAAAIAAERFPVRLLFAGGFDPAARDAREFKRIQALVESLGLADRAVFLGQLEPLALSRLHSASDVVVVPSHYESFGLVAIEAMACGAPVVASEVGGLRYTVAHRQTGLLAPARDHAAFARAIETLLEDPALRARMGEAGRRMVRASFTWDAVAAQLGALYAELSPALSAGGAPGRPA